MMVRWALVALSACQARAAWQRWRWGEGGGEGKKSEKGMHKDA
jgi:hypothetical protein